MFARVSAVFLFAIFALPLFVVAMPGGSPPNTVTVTVTTTAPGSTTTPISQCNTGDVQCCNSVESANSSGLSGLLGLLGIIVGDITGLVGLGCSPISVIGIGSGANCVQQPVCCTDNQFNGLINLGCSPININL